MPVVIEPAERVAEWRRRYLEGESPVDIAASECAAGRRVDADHVRCVLVGNGVQLRTQAEARRVATARRKSHSSQAIEARRAKVRAELIRAPMPSREGAPSMDEQGPQARFPEPDVFDRVR